MHFEIAYKWVFLLLPLPLVVYLLLPSLKKRRSALIVPFLGRAAAVSGEVVRKGVWVARRGFFGWLMLVLCWICLVAAASSPQFVGEPGKKVRTVRSFLVVADISFSMAQTDWVLDGKRVSRWEATKNILKDFVRRRKSDQMGLVLFATHAYLQSPLTTDLDAIDWLLDQTEVGMAGQMTSIGEAIAFGTGVLKRDTMKQKVMLLLTDGIDEGKSINPMDASASARDDSILIYTLGIGKAQGGGGYDLDEKTLKGIASVTKGRYFNAMNEGQLKEVYNVLDKIEPIQYEEEDYKPVRLLYVYPLALAVGLGLVFHLINGLATIFRRNYR
ncbi:MAG TPA: VWA domain-containing protein [Puia sp.]